MPDRNPRLDPRPGDVLRRDYQLRRVVSLRGVWVKYATENGKQYNDAINPWRSWAAKAEVVEVGRG